MGEEMGEVLNWKTISNATDRAGVTETYSCLTTNLARSPIHLCHNRSKLYECHSQVVTFRLQ